MRDGHRSTSNTQEMWTAAVCWRGAFTTRTCWGATPSSQPALVILGRLLLRPDSHWGTHAGIQAHADIWNTQKQACIDWKIKFSPSLDHHGFIQSCVSTANTTNLWSVSFLPLVNKILRSAPASPALRNLCIFSFETRRCRHSLWLHHTELQTAPVQI